MAGVKGKSGLRRKYYGPTLPDHRICSRCAEQRPCSMFPLKGGFCRPCDNDRGKKNICQFDGCGKLTSKTWCTVHGHVTRGLKQRGVDHYKWKGGKHTTKQGYVVVSGLYDHPNAKSKQKKLFEHVLIMEEKLGRYLVKGENVHHKNGIRNDNRIENLELWWRKQPSGQRVEDIILYLTSTGYKVSLTADPKKMGEMFAAIGRDDAK